MAYRLTFTPSIIRHLQTIERARKQMRLTVLPPPVAERLRLATRVRSPHHSTRIEGDHALADVWQTRSRYPFDRLAEIDKTVEHFFGQLALEGVRPEYA